MYHSQAQGDWIVLCNYAGSKLDVHGTKMDRGL
jgi:hypothetical protein